MLSNGLEAPMTLRPTSVAGSYSQYRHKPIKVSRRYGAAPLAGPFALQKPTPETTQLLRVADPTQQLSSATSGLVVGDIFGRKNPDPCLRKPPCTSACGITAVQISGLTAGRIGGGR